MKEDEFVRNSLTGKELDDVAARLPGEYDDLLPGATAPLNLLVATAAHRCRA